MTVIATKNVKKIYLIRHGQSHSNAGGAAQPNAKIELTQLGQQQASLVADWLLATLGQNISAVHVSKFIRTQQTAKPLIDKLGITTNVIEGLQEFDYISFDKIKNADLHTRRNIADSYWLEKQPDEREGAGAESYQEFCERVVQVLEQFKQLPEGNHVVYTHGLWISMLIWQILGQPCSSNVDMQKFRQFELSIRARNCEVFLLTLSDNHPPAITKVRSCFKAPLDAHLIKDA